VRSDRANEDVVSLAVPCDRQEGLTMEHVPGSDLSTKFRAQVVSVVFGRIDQFAGIPVGSRDSMSATK
jgi:hypothetical protein